MLFTILLITIIVLIYAAFKSIFVTKIIRCSSSCLCHKFVEHFFGAFVDVSFGHSFILHYVWFCLFLFASDPRSPPTQTPPPQWAVPNQSKSFRILQKMTDTIADGQTSEEDTGPAELQQPHYSRPLGPADMNENQLRKLQLTDNDRILMNRVKNQGR